VFVCEEIWKWYLSINDVISHVIVVNPHTVHGLKVTSEKSLPTSLVHPVVPVALGMGMRSLTHRCLLPGTHAV